MIGEFEPILCLMDDNEWEYEKQIVLLREKQIQRIDFQIAAVAADSDREIDKIKRQAELNCEAVKSSADVELKRLTMKRRLESCLLDLDRRKQSFMSDMASSTLGDICSPLDMFNAIYNSTTCPSVPVHHRLLEYCSGSTSHTASHTAMENAVPSGVGSPWNFADFDDMDMNRIDLSNIETSSAGAVDKANGIYSDLVGSSDGGDGVGVREDGPETRRRSSGGEGRKQNRRTHSTRESKVRQAKVDTTLPMVKRRRKSPAYKKPGWVYVPVDDNELQEKSVILEGKRARKKKSYEYES